MIRGLNLKNVNAFKICQRAVIKYCQLKSVPLWCVSYVPWKRKPLDCLHSRFFIRKTIFFFYFKYICVYANLEIFYWHKMEYFHFINTVLLENGIRCSTFSPRRYTHDITRIALFAKMRFFSLLYFLLFIIFFFYPVLSKYE